MRKLFALILAVVLTLTGCVSVVEGVSQEKYDALREEYEALQAEYSTLKKEHEELASMLALFGDVDATEDDVENQGKFDAENVLSQLEVTEYSYDPQGWHYAFLVIANNSEFDINVSVAVKFYNEAGALIGARDAEENAFESGSEIVLYFMPDEAYAKMEYELAVSEEDWYECVVSDLTYETVSAKDKEIVSVTNKGSKTAEFVEGSALFFDGDNVVGFDRTYFTDNDSELKPGKTITKELSCYEEYDSVKLFFTGRR